MATTTHRSPTLPPELIHLIIHNLSSSRADLHALSLTNTHLSAAATPLLYARMVETRASTQSPFIAALQTNTKLAAFVRVYHFPENDDVSPPGEMWRGIRSVLGLMHGLKELMVCNIRIYRWPYRSLSHSNSTPSSTNTTNPPIPLTLLDPGAQPPFQLEKLIMHATSAERAPADITRFVCTQKQLKYLIWTTEDCLPESIPDSVECIGGLSDPLRQLLILSLNPEKRKQQIQKARWINHYDPNARENAALFALPAFTHLRVLSIAALGSIQYMVLRHIRDSVGVAPFVNLEVLITSCHIGAFENNPGILRKFPILSELILTQCISESFLSTVSTQRIIQSLFKEYPNLIEVDVDMTIIMTVNMQKQCRRWVKGELLDGWYVLSDEKVLEYSGSLSR